MKASFIFGLLLSMVILVFQGGPTPQGVPTPVVIPASTPDPGKPLPEPTVLKPETVLVVNMVPADQSGEQNQDSEPFLAVNSEQNLMVGAAYQKKSNETAATPLLLSSADGGWTWKSKSLLPAKRIGAQSYCFSGKGNSFYGAVLSIEGTEQAVSVFHSDDPANDQPLANISTLTSGSEFGDAPFIQVRTFGSAPTSRNEADQRLDRVFVGQNYFGFPDPQQSRTASIRVWLNDGKPFRLLGIETRDTGTARQDGPAVRPAVAADGVVYVAFLHWTSREKNQFRGDVVVVRDDDSARGDTSFRSLVDPTDGLPGRIVTKDSLFAFEKLGKQRVISPLSLAVVPNHSEIVYVAWGDYDMKAKTHVLHVKRSSDKGQTWSEDLLPVSSGANPALAVSEQGTVGLLYQQLSEAGTPQETWETHFRSSTDRGEKWADIPLATFPTAVEPELQSDPYLGDRTHLLAVKTNFYGVFSAPNVPSQEYFPKGVVFKRRNYNGQLLSNNNQQVATSIDPYFFRISPSSEVPLPLSVNYESDLPKPQTRLGALVLKFGLPLAIAIGSLMALLATLQVLRFNKKATSTIEKIYGPALVNYTGYVAAQFTDLKGWPITETTAGERSRLIVTFATHEPTDPWIAHIDLREGENGSVVAFSVEIDTSDFKVDPPHQTRDVPTKGSSTMTFSLVASEKREPRSVYVQVYQKTLLVQVLTAKIAGPKARLAHGNS